MRTSPFWIALASSAVSFAVVAGCGSTNGVNDSGGGAGGGDAKASEDGATSGSDGGVATGDAATGTEGGLPLGEAGAPLTCTAPATYTNNYVGCGSERWTVKTGADSQAATISLTPTETTIAALVALNGGKPYSSPPATSRVSPDETKLVFLRDINLIYARAESDSDYHLGIEDAAMNKMIAEIPYPGSNGKCLDVGNPWSCLISHARAAADATLMPTSSGHDPGLVATIVGVPFYDYPHGQTDEAPNGIELHPVLAICFGKGCTP